jgi:hypothetical protein
VPEPARGATLLPRPPPLPSILSRQKDRVVAEVQREFRQRNIRELDVFGNTHLPLPSAQVRTARPSVTASFHNWNDSAATAFIRASKRKADTNAPALIFQSEALAIDVQDKWTWNSLGNTFADNDSNSASPTPAGLT